jgi:hypothetical protein
MQKYMSLSTSLSILNLHWVTTSQAKAKSTAIDFVLDNFMRVNSSFTPRVMEVRKTSRDKLRFWGHLTTRQLLCSIHGCSGKLYVNAGSEDDVTNTEKFVKSFSQNFNHPLYHEVTFQDSLDFINSFESDLFQFDIIVLDRDKTKKIVDLFNAAQRLTNLILVDNYNPKTQGLEKSDLNGHNPCPLGWGQIDLNFNKCLFGGKYKMSLFSPQFASVDLGKITFR